MCVVDLNRATLPCEHAWYHLIQACSPTATLPTCPGKLSIEGWEIRCDFCPFCAGWPLSPAEFILLGTNAGAYALRPRPRQDSSSSTETATESSSSSTSGSATSSTSKASDGFNSTLSSSSIAPWIPLSRRPSLATSVSGARRLSRSWNSAIADGAGINLPQFEMGPVGAASFRNARMNALMEQYMGDDPLPLAERSRSMPLRVDNKAMPAVDVARVPTAPELSAALANRDRSEERTDSEEDEDDEVPASRNRRKSVGWRRRSRTLVQLARRTVFW